MFDCISKPSPFHHHSKHTMVFSVTEAEVLAKEVSSSGGRFINPSKIDGEIRIRLFGEGVTGFEGWTNDSKPVR